MTEEQSDFVLFTRDKSQKLIAIRKSAIKGIYPIYSDRKTDNVISTVIEYGGDSVIVQESFEHVCNLLDIYP